MGRRLDKQAAGVVYFVETHDARFVKIGFSTNVKERLQTLLIDQPGLRLIGHLPGDFKAEHYLHQKFKRLKERGEWFRQDEELREFIRTSVIEKRVEVASEVGSSPKKPAKVRSGVKMARSGVNMVVGAEAFKRIDDFRFANRFKRRSEAIRWLLEAALDKGLTPKKPTS